MRVKERSDLVNVFTLEANTMNPDQTAPKGAVLSGSILFAIYATKVLRRMREQTVNVMNSVKRVQPLMEYGKAA